MIEGGELERVPKQVGSDGGRSGACLTRGTNEPLHCLRVAWGVAAPKLFGDLQRRGSGYGESSSRLAVQGGAHGWRHVRVDRVANEIVTKSQARFLCAFEDAGD
jgi:hypothetical protein